jgi:hypothetical protein
VISNRIEELLDLDLDPLRGLVRPRLPPLSPEDKFVMGPLAKAKASSLDAIDVLEGIYDCMQREMYEDLTSGNPAVIVRALNAICRAFEVLIRSGYPQFFPLLTEMQAAFNRVVQITRREMVKRLLSPKTSDADAEQIGRSLADLIEAGAWPGDWEAEFKREVEACATRPRT